MSYLYIKLKKVDAVLVKRRINGAKSKSHLFFFASAFLSQSIPCCSSITILHIYIYIVESYEKKRFILNSPMCIEEPDLKKELKTIRNYSQASLCDKNYSFFSCQTYCTYKIVICKSWWQGKWKKEKFAQNTLQEHAAKFLVQHIAREPQKYNNLKDKPTLENSARVLSTYV